MPFATYVASESIIPIHLANISYTFDFKIQSADRSKQILKVSKRSLAGNKVTLYFGRIATWAITMVPVPANECALIEEFLDSTADGQIFTFDPYGSSQNPLAAMTCDREDDGHEPRRIIMTGDPMNSDYFEYSFKINQVS